MTATVMMIVMALILGGLTGWVSSIPADGDVRRGLLASVSIGGVGSLLGVALVAGLGLQPHSLETWTIVLGTVVLTAAWLVGMLRAAMGLFSSSAGAWR